MYFGSLYVTCLFSTHEKQEKNYEIQAFLKYFLSMFLKQVQSLIIGID